MNRGHWTWLLVLVLAASASRADVAAGVLEEIIVSAQRIDERLLDVPVSVTVLAGTRLDEFAVTRWDDLNLPGIKIGPGGITDALSIRGIGSGINFGFEQSAPMFIDGVWFGSSRATRIGFVDTERVEILKGPQPTHFGKNVIAGAFGVVSRKPQPQFESSIDLYHEFEHDETAVGAMLNVPFGEQFAARLAGRWRDMVGFMSNSETGRKTPQYEDELARLSLRWTPSEELTLDGKLDYSKNVTDGREVQHVRCVPEAFTNPRLLNPAFEDCRMDTVRGFRYDRAAFGAAMDLFENPDRPGERFENELLSGLVSADWRFGGGYTANLDVAYYDQDFHAEAKPDMSWNQRGLAAFEDSTRFFSQELRFASPADGRWFWTAGAYHEEVARDNAPFTQMFLPFGVALITEALLDNDAWAVFGELALRVADTLTLRAGGRYTDASAEIDSKRAVYVLMPGPQTPGADPFSYAVPARVIPVASFATAQSRGDEDFTPAATLEWRPRTGQLFYLSWREGFKAGGFNSFLDGPIEEIGFERETVDYLEAGLKLEALSGSWRLSAAAFEGDYSDLQLWVVDPTSGESVIRNAGGARSRGLELEGAWALLEHWELGAALTLLDAEYTDFRDADCYPTPAQTIGEGCVQAGGAPLPPDATLCLGQPGVSCAQDLTGFPTSFAPDWSGSLSLRYRQPLDLGWLDRPLAVSAELALMVTDEFYTSTNGAPGSVQESYAKLDARVAVSGADGRWELAFVGRNLTDEIYGLWYEPLPGGGLNTGWFTTTARPRQLGAQLTLRF